MWKGGGALVHVYVWEHIVSLNYRITWMIITKFDKDKVLMTPHICFDIWAKSAHVRIQDGVKLGIGVPFFKELFLYTVRLRQQTKCIEFI